MPPNYWIRWPDYATAYPGGPVLFPKLQFLQKIQVALAYIKNILLLNLIHVCFYHFAFCIHHHDAIKILQMQNTDKPVFPWEKT